MKALRVELVPNWKMQQDEGFVALEGWEILSIEWAGGNYYRVVLFR